MTKVLLTLILPKDVSEHVEDLLLSRPDLSPGFTSAEVAGHGSVSAEKAEQEVCGAEETTLSELACCMKDRLGDDNSR